MTAIDATGLGAIRDLADSLHASGRSLLLCGAREQPSQLMKQADFERQRRQGEYLHAALRKPCNAPRSSIDAPFEIGLLHQLRRVVRGRHTKARSVPKRAESPPGRG